MGKVRRGRSGRWMETEADMASESKYYYLATSTHIYHTWLMFDWIVFFYRNARNNHRGLICVVTMFVRTFTRLSTRERIVNSIKRYVNNIHKFILLPSVLLSFSHNCFIMIWYIHIHITHVFISISFFCSWKESGRSSPYSSASKQLARNLRDFSFRKSYLLSESTTLFHSMPQCNSELGTCHI